LLWALLVVLGVDFAIHTGLRLDKIRQHRSTFRRKKWKGLFDFF